MFKIISKKKLESNSLKADMVSRVQDFMQKCGQDVDGHNPEQVSLYIGLIAEELREVVAALAERCSDRNSLSLYLIEKDTLPALDYLAQLGKRGALSDMVESADQAELLDGFIDCAIVSLGAAISSSPDAAAAVEEVLAANDAKVSGGLDENGKIQKPAGWVPPDLSGFVYKNS